MPLENATYIHELNASNPVGSSDLVSSADDHLRLLKAALLATFPNITGEVTASHSQISALDGGTLAAASGENLTALNASNLDSGTVDDARLSSNVALKDGTNTWSAFGTFSAGLRVADGAEMIAGDGADLRMYHDGTDSYIDNDTGALVITTPGTLSLNGVDIADYARQSQANTFAAGQTISVADDAEALRLTESDGMLRMWPHIDSIGGAYLAATDSDAQTSTNLRIDAADITLNPTGVLKYGALEVGYRGIPSGSFAENGKTVYATGGATLNTGLAAGTTFGVYNNSASTITLTQGSGLTLRLAGSAATGNRAIAPRGWATIHYISTSEAIIAGPGVS